MFHTDWTGKVLILTALALVLLAIWRGAYVLTVKRRRQQAEMDQWGRDLNWRDDSPYEDDNYVAALHGDHERLVPAFPGRVMSDIPLPEPVTGVLAALPELPRSRPLPPMSNEELAMELERDDYLTGRTLRILRKERETREGWHWDELTGTWNPGRDFVEALPWDDWLRNLLETDDRVGAA